MIATGPVGWLRVVAALVALATTHARALDEIPLEAARQPADRVAQARRDDARHARLVATRVTRALDVPVQVEIDDADRHALEEPPPRAGRRLVGVVKPLGLVVDFSDLPPGRLPAGQHRRPVGAIRGSDDGGWVWTAVVESPGARALRLRLTNVDLPDGATLWVYNANGTSRGPYTGTGPHDTSELWTHTILGASIVIQLDVPAHARRERAPTFDIAALGHIGPGFLPDPVASPDAGSNLCVVNQACVQNASCAVIPPAIQDARQAVALIEFVSGAFLYTCSGGLVADTDPATDVPYFLTAHHCLSRKNEASSLEAFFQFSTTCGGTCSDPAATAPSTLGATVVETDRQTDFTLLLLRESAPAGSAFLGWTSTAVAATDGVPLFRVSHPSGAPQAYSEHVVDTSRPTCQTWPRGDHIYSTDTFGATEGGSSGSPVLNAAGQIVGQLSGGCGFNIDNVCDAANNATVDGAFAAYFSLVQPILDPAGDTTTTSSSSSTTSSSLLPTTTSSSSSSSSTTSTAVTSTSATTTSSSSSTTSSSLLPMTTSSSSTSTSTTSTAVTSTSATTASSSSSTTSSSLLPTTTSSSSTSTSTTSTPTTSTTSTIPAGCHAAPQLGCHAPRKAMLTINEARTGHERLAFGARSFGPGLALEDLGDPVRGTTAYRLCIYDAAERLIGQLAVDRAGASCRPNGRACWKATRRTGYAYRDRSSSADGVKRLVARGGGPGKGAIRLKARNKARKGYDALPRGLTAALASNERAVVQLVADDAGCVTATLERVRKADGTTFKAKIAP